MNLNGHVAPQRDVEAFDDGWVQLARKMMRSPVWASAELWKLYTWCLMRARYVDGWVAVRVGRGETTVELKKGQFIFGRHAAAAELGMPSESVRTRLEKLEQLGLINTAPTNHFTIVTVCAVDVSGSILPELHQPSTNETPSKHQLSTTQPPQIRKNKKAENGKKDLAPSFFDEWYAAYPRHVAKDPARKAFGKALSAIASRHDGDEQAALSWLMDRTRSYAGVVVGKDPKYVPHPATWLNQARYDDEPGQLVRFSLPAKAPPEPPVRIQRAAAV